MRAWVREAVAAIGNDHEARAETPLIALPGHSGLFLKDESVHPTGSLKHRLARSLFLYGLVNGWIREGAPVIDASSGSTAISEAYFARRLGLPFIAVVPASTAGRKIAAIEELGGRVDRIDDPRGLEKRCRQLALETGGHFLDQFTYAERATEWRGNNNIAASLFEQVRQQAHKAPAWVVVGAGTGGTAATLGRYIRYTPALAATTKLCVVDPEGSAYFNAYRSLDWSRTGRSSPAVEGIGRPRVEASFVHSVVDCMISVPDAASIAACLWLESKLGRRVGPSTGTNLIGSLLLAERKGAGPIVTLICDGGDRYAETIYDPAWRAKLEFDLRPWSAMLSRWERTGAFDADLAVSEHDNRQREILQPDYAI